MHILLTAYLIITLMVGIYTLIGSTQDLLYETSYKNILLVAIGLLDAFFTILLLKWKKWGLVTGHDYKNIIQIPTSSAVKWK